MEKFKMATERLFLRSPNINVCFRVKIDRSFDQKEISAAIEKVCERHPLLKCAIEIDDEHNGWFVPKANPIEIEYYKHEEMPDWKSWYNKRDAIPFDFINGPLVRICIITGNREAQIIILGHHIIGDGIAYLNLAKDILSALDNQLETSAQTPPDNKFIKGKKLGLLSRLYAKKLNKAWRKNKIHFCENDYLEFFHNYRNRFIPQIYIDSINEDELKKLIELCKLNKLTVNELLTSAFAIEFADNRELRIGVAASTRGELTTKPYYCMGNYVTGISIKTHCSQANDFMSNIKNISGMLRAELRDIKKRHAIVNFLECFDNDLIESIMFASYGNYQAPIAKKIGTIIAEGLEGKGLGMSNLGRHKLNSYNSFALLDLQFIGPAFPANIISISAITVNNKLNICFRYNEPEIETDTVITIYQKAMKSIFNAGIVCKSNE